ncbi:hypothetical protein O6H91_20G073900 [Diphasiastrum complanatum]|uniref:Uncharacterized protein n=1 Tax=Diphasiastrum complanatum TaxID=34168 RepID=A0ACC2ARU4_DIPCM|nr:hypothetical protein O6H91_20G073900 [Diphasiastrum complanatum]
MEGIVKTKMSEARSLEKWPGKKCKTCGDVGFHEELFKCTTCQATYQHTYCSIMHTNLVVDEWICHWCSHVPSTIAVKHPRMKIKRGIKHSVKAQLSKSSNALELLLAVAQSMLSGEVAEDGDVNKQKTFQRQGLRKKCSALKEKRKLGVNELSHLSKNQLCLTTSRKGVARRYKLLSDVYG